MPASTVSTVPLRLHLARSARSTAERKKRTYSQPCAVPRTATGVGMSAKYFSGTATTISAISRTPTTLAITR